VHANSIRSPHGGEPPHLPLYQALDNLRTTISPGFARPPGALVRLGAP